MVHNQVMSFAPVEASVGDSVSFKQLLANIFALETYMHNIVGNINSHLNFGMNKKKGMQMCFDLFH